MHLLLLSSQSDVRQLDLKKKWPRDRSDALETIKRNDKSKCTLQAACGQVRDVLEITKLGSITIKHHLSASALAKTMLFSNFTKCLFKVSHEKIASAI